MPSAGDCLAGRYELIQQIGIGGMATVWRGRDLRLDRPVAIKLLRPELAEDQDFARRFESEAKLAASLAHPNVATVYDTDVDGSQRFIVMELVDGPTVADIIRDRGSLDPSAAVEIAAGAARALASAHRRGLIHRDVKPGNLLLGRDGRVRLADFGIARALTAMRVTTPGTILGSVPYLSPEQARGEEATPAGDIFSLGVVLFEMLTGKLPWDPDSVAAMATVRLHVPAPAPSRLAERLPDGLDGIVGRALEIDPSRRYPSARVLADALEAWNRAIPSTGGAGTGIRQATATLAASVLPAASPALAGRAVAAATARPNPSARLPLERGGTRRAAQPPPPPPAAGREAIEDDEGDSAASRWGGALLALLAAGLVLATLVGFLGAGSMRPLPTAAAGGPAAAASPMAGATVALVPGPTATPSITIPTPLRTPAPTPAPPATRAPKPTPASTPLPTPRPTTPSTVSAAAAAVVAFYGAAEAHDWDTAINRWSPVMQERYPPQEWLIDRFRQTSRIDITRLRTVSLNTEAGTAQVAVTLVEYRSVEPSPRMFSGAWDLVRIDGRWVLDNPDF